jgi:hypothetical protein
VVGFLIAWASAAKAQPTSLAPTDWDQGLTLSEAHDNNPDPKIVEIDLTARIAEVDVAAGHTVRAWTPSALWWCSMSDQRVWMFHCHILDHADGGLMRHVHLHGGSSE